MVNSLSVLTLLPNTPLFFVEKMREAFAFFTTTNTGIFHILKFEVLTEH